MLLSNQDLESKLRGEVGVFLAEMGSVVPALERLHSISALQGDSGSSVNLLWFGFHSERSEVDYCEGWALGHVASD